MLRVLCVCLFLLLTACKPNEDSRVKAIIGAVLIDGNGGPPITDSVVVVSGSRIRSAGLRANVPIPAGSDKINGSGKFLTPGLIDLYSTTKGDAWIYSGVTTTRLFPAGREFTGETTDPDTARRKVGDLAAQQADFLFVRADDARLNPAVADVILEEARKFKIPVTARITTLAQTQQLVKSGAEGFLGMIGDTEEIDQAFLAQLRSLNVVFVPVLSLTKSSITMRNTKRMAAAGVPIGVGSGGATPGTLHEMELLAEAGLSPLEVTAAATRTGALTMRNLSLGTIEAEKRADLLLLNANPLEDVRNFGKIDRMMLEGEWVDRASLKGEMTTSSNDAQAFSVKRAEVEFHNFASLGEPERAIEAYAQENIRRGAVIRNQLEFIGEMSPFLEIGANAGHTSYLLANDFGANGFALDLSSDALRYGAALMDRWGLSRAPIRVAGDALNLPFKDGSLRFVLAFQTLSQFMNMESVFLEVNRVLAPGGIFLFAEEPLLRLLSLRLYRLPYYDLMKPWEKKLYDWGLLGYLARDVIGAHQEESFGIRQNHSMYLNHWSDLISRHFVEKEYEIFVPERGWGERVVKNLAIRLDPHGSEWRAARLLGGTLAAVCRKAGQPSSESTPVDRYDTLLRCPDCRKDLRHDESDTLCCASCGYRAPNEGGVYTLLRSEDRAELYPGDRDDVIDFCVPNHEAKLLDGWYDLEGVFGGKYRWIGASASAKLRPVRPGRQRLRIRGHIHENSFAQGEPAQMTVSANGVEVGRTVFERSGVFVLEANLPVAEEYRIEIAASPVWQAPPDDRVFSANIGMIRLVPVE